MAFNLVIFGNSNKIDVKNYNCLEMFNTKEKYEEIYDLADWKCEYNKFSYDGGLKQQTRGRSK